MNPDPSLARTGGAGGRTDAQVAVSEFRQKISAFEAASRASEIMLISAIGSLTSGKGMADAVGRAEAFLDAGSEAVLIRSAASGPDEVCRFAEELRGNGILSPIFVEPAARWAAPLSAFEASGINAVIYANQMLRATIRPLERLAQTILSDGYVDEATDGRDMISIPELLAMIPETF
jgi:phosphoenolpyruvate phosphomutase